MGDLGTEELIYQGNQRDLTRSDQWRVNPRVADSEKKGE